MAYTTRELSARTFRDFAALAVQQGECWCIFYQRPRPVGRGLSAGQRSALNRKDKEALVVEKRSHAILVYDGKTPIGWCQYGRRDELPRIDARRTYRETPPADETETLWRITCFFVARSHRGKGIAKFALHAALESIRRQGGGTVEAYPVVSEKMAAVAEWRWFGTVGMFRREGFQTIAPLGTSGVLVRKLIAP
ncbi:MAG TPA: GNAT family N-acetyltransferase [Thermoplasmata archaeon]|nr:GNAT family N-acetyltransferase [Thermoplasmata archaeon]